MIPFGVEGDDGFLSSTRDLGQFDANHGYKCRVVRFVTDREIQYKQRAFFAYKLRRRSYSNSDPRGQPFVDVVGGGRWISTYRWVHRE